MKARAALARGAPLALGALLLVSHALTAGAASEDKLVFSGNGMTLTGDHGGGGGAATWLRQFDTGNLLGLGAEYQQIYNSHWTLGTFNGALKFGQGSIKTSLYTEAHVGSGSSAGEPFDYTNIAGGFISALTPWLSVQLEERYIDIQPSHGHLPKLGLSFLLAPKVLASVSYAQSFGGNLGTKLGTARLDYVGMPISWLIVCDMPARTEPMRKTTIEVRKMFFRPYRSPILPQSGVETVVPST